jgi:antibiotic biosynthesis monooxygenase (ABM) superfamily enzyme
MLTKRLTVIAALYLHAGREAEFAKFETAAAEIMGRYGGTIERRIGVAPGSGENLPYEVHILSFPDERSFQGYRTDPDLESLRDLRALAIRETVLWLGTELPAYGS